VVTPPSAPPVLVSRRWSALIAGPRLSPTSARAPSQCRPAGPPTRARPSRRLVSALALSTSPRSSPAQARSCLCTSRCPALITGQRSTPVGHSLQARRSTLIACTLGCSGPSSPGSGPASAFKLRQYLPRGHTHVRTRPALVAGNACHRDRSAGARWRSAPAPAHRRPIRAHPNCRPALALVSDGSDPLSSTAGARRWPAPVTSTRSAPIVGLL
jgi:hypothetical protein